MRQTGEVMALRGTEEKVHPKVHIWAKWDRAAQVWNLHLRNSFFFFLIPPWGAIQHPPESPNDLIISSTTAFASLDTKPIPGLGTLIWNLKRGSQVKNCIYNNMLYAVPQVLSVIFWLILRFHPFSSISGAAILPLHVALIMWCHFHSTCGKMSISSRWIEIVAFFCWIQRNINQNAGYRQVEAA